MATLQPGKGSGASRSVDLESGRGSVVPLQCSLPVAGTGWALLGGEPGLPSENTSPGTLGFERRSVEGPGVKKIIYPETYLGD